MDIVVLNEKS